MLFVRGKSVREDANREELVLVLCSRMCLLESIESLGDDCDLTNALRSLMTTFNSERPKTCANRSDSVHDADRWWWRTGKHSSESPMMTPPTGNRLYSS